MAAFATSILKTTPLLMSVNAAAECRARNDRQSYFTISRALAHAQFELADAELTRRYWQEVPRTREVMPIGDRSRVRAADGLEEARTLVDPAVLVGRSPAHAAMLAELRAAGTLHMLGREVFYFKTAVAPASARQSRRRVAEWQALFKDSQKSSIK